jgi:hypothetical protein
MTINPHILHHMVSCVERHGPLWTFWAFPFEGALGQLKVFSHAKHAIEKQLVFSANVKSALPLLCELAYKQPWTSVDDREVCLNTL